MLLSRRLRASPMEELQGNYQAPRGGGGILWCWNAWFRGRKGREAEEKIPRSQGEGMIQQSNGQWQDLKWDGASRKKVRIRCKPKRSGSPFNRRVLESSLTHQTACSGATSRPSDCPKKKRGKNPLLAKRGGDSPDLRVETSGLGGVSGKNIGKESEIRAFCWKG